MKGLKLFIVLAMLLALVTTLSASPADEKETLYENDEDTLFYNPDEAVDVPLPESEHPMSSLRGVNRFLGQKKPQRATMTCDKYPRVCRTKGSPGPDCCKKKCVNVMTDKLNCGQCGKKCKYPEICCKGECVNPRSNKRHCGGCNNRCKKGNMCVYGMCSYA